MTARRLPTGGKIDRSTTLHFKWDGRTFTGHPGDTLASALMASDEKVLARSFKYHRPRGIMSAGVEESGAMVTTGDGAARDPNIKASTCELFDGLVAAGQNAYPNVRFDLGSINNVLGRFFAAGFYYKTFMGIPPFEWASKGTGLWMKYEKIIRNAAGMGRASREPDPDTYEHGRDFCDVLVVGSGPTGLSAALAAARGGLDVLLVEQDFELGGSGLFDSSATGECAAMIEQLEDAGVRVMTRTTAFGLYDCGTAGLVERVSDHMASSPHYVPRQRFITVTARHTIVAAGAIERLIAFGDNDRPGIMNVSAGRVYLNRFGVLPGEKIVIASNNDSSYETAQELVRAGASVTLLDARPGATGQLIDAAMAAGVEVRFGEAPLKAVGKAAVTGLKTARVTGGKYSEGSSIDCDLILLSGGWSPLVNLQSHRGVKPTWNAENACFVPGDCSEPLTMAGSCAGIWMTQDCIEAGRAAAAEALKTCGKPAETVVTPGIGGWLNPLMPVYEVAVEGTKTKSFIDPQHDVTADDVRLAHLEGFVSVEHLKRYTTLGMATDQGKMGNIIGIALMAEALGREVPEVGTTTFRPPYTPISLGALTGRGVGEHFRPLRRTPMHEWNLEQNATMTEADWWHRPWFYAREGETITEAYIRETETSRRTIGLCDVTSLGKIAIQGPDATEFLNRIYSNPFAKLAIGKARYGIMLRDDGIVFDDGTTWRLGETEYFMTTTTAKAGGVMVFLEELLQTRWPDLRVHVTSVSEQWGGTSIAGPRSRELLEACCDKPEAVSNDNLPFMGVIETTLKGGIPCRIARISFSGEMAYETYVPSDYGRAMMELFWGVAKDWDGCLYGTEALGAMRIEKGHVTGAELDGRVTIDQAGLGKMASDKKHYIGSQLRKRPELMREDRPRLVGIFPKDRSETFNAGSLLCPKANTEGFGDGWISAVTHSPALGHWIGLGFLTGGHESWEGKTLVASDPVRKGDIEVEVVSPHMYDPSGEKMHG